MTGFHELVYPELEKKQLTGYIIISTAITLDEPE